MPATNLKYIDGNGNDAVTSPTTASAGTASAGQVVGLNAAGLIDGTMLSTTNAVTMAASEAVSAGSLVNVWMNGSTPAVRNADNSNIAKKADGFAPAAIASGASGTVVLREGMNASVTGLTPGAEYFLGAAGAVTATPPTTTGSIVQKVGPAASATMHSFLGHAPTIRA